MLQYTKSSYAIVCIQLYINRPTYGCDDPVFSNVWPCSVFLQTPCRKSGLCFFSIFNFFIYFFIPPSRAGEKSMSSKAPATEESAQSPPCDEKAVSSQPDCISQNPPCTQENCEGQLCQSEREGVDVAVEGGGEQAAEALPLDESCCHVDTDRHSPKCLSELGDLDPDQSAKEPHCSPATNPAAQGSPSDTSEGPVMEKPAHSNPDGSSEVTCSALPSNVTGKVEIPEQEQYNSFHYWRTPIPQIDLDLELSEEKCNSDDEVSAASSSTQGSTSALDRKQLEELIENLEPHIDDPDVKGEESCFSVFL